MGDEFLLDTIILFSQRTSSRCHQDPIEAVSRTTEGGETHPPLFIQCPFQFIIKANKTNPQVIQQLIQALAKGGIATQAQIQQFIQSIQAAHKTSAIQIDQPAPPRPAPEPSQNIVRDLFFFVIESELQLATNLAKQTPQQRATHARQAFRLQADKQLQQFAVQNLSAHADLQFIPNPNQADFPSLVALDIIVQRILKDKIATA